VRVAVRNECCDWDLVKSGGRSCARCFLKTDCLRCECVERSSGGSLSPGHYYYYKSVDASLVTSSVRPVTSSCAEPGLGSSIEHRD